MSSRDAVESEEPSVFLDREVLPDFGEGLANGKRDDSMSCFVVRSPLALMLPLVSPWLARRIHSIAHCQWTGLSVSPSLTAAGIGSLRTADRVLSF
jgi:hypothetical protein